jgi:phosphohistidine phosphatase
VRVYLVRHGNAAPKSADPERHLSPQGREQVRKVTQFLKPLGLRVGSIWHSTKTRAGETAAILSAAVYAAEGLVERDDLAPNHDINPVRRDIDRAGDDLMVVGHLPFLDHLASRLLAGSDAAETLKFAEGAVACLEGDASDGRRLVWMVTPDLLWGAPA